MYKNATRFEPVTNQETKTMRKGEIDSPKGEHFNKADKADGTTVSKYEPY